MLETFHKYMGTGIMLLWYIAALIYLSLREKRRPARILFLYVPLILLLVILNPLFAVIYEKFLGMEIYFRNLWLLPVTVTLAYCPVRICREWFPEEGKKQDLRRGLLCLSMAVLILLSGKPVYQNPLFSRAENIHHVPREMVQICDMISLDGREVMAAFPAEHLLYVRQYTGKVCMPYGRDALQGYFRELYHVLQADCIDVERMAALAKEQKCHYVIFSKEKTLEGRMEDYDYEWFGETEHYLVYRDNTMNFSLIYQKDK